MGMLLPPSPPSSHPKGEPECDRVSTATQAGALQPARVPLDLHGRRIYVEWDPHAPVTPLGQLVYFSQFLATAGLFTQWVADCPLHYTSSNAPEKADVLGTILLAVLAGNRRYAHVTALRGDTVNPQGLGMSRVMSEDAVRRAFQDEEAGPLADWQQGHLWRSVEPVLAEPWICDLDVTIKTVYGWQEGGEVGYNPHKPGRRAHAYHTFFISRLRLALDVVVAPGKQFHSRAVSQTFWPWWEKLPAHCRPTLVRADCNFGNENFMLDCEQRGQPYLFRLRQTRGGQRQMEQLSRQGQWQECGQGWQGKETTLRLSGWSRPRRVIVLRRRTQPVGPLELSQGTQPSLLSVAPVEPYEYALLVTNTDWEIVALGRLYRERADSENTIDELKRQWGWGGFVTRDLLRCQVAARNVALIYNWWSLFVRCVEPERAREAVTSRPLLLSAIGREVRHAGQTTVVLTSTHAEAGRVQRLLNEVSLFLSGLRNSAEQLSPAQCWARIWERVLRPFRMMEAASRAWFGHLARLPG